MGAGVAQAASTYLGEQRRRSTRLDQTLPVVVRGVDLLGQPFEERTATQAVSFHGCRYASKHHLPKNTWVTIEVTASPSQREPLRVRARVAWIHRPRTLRELFHVGVELESGANIWGVAVPPEDWGAAAADSGAILEVTPFPAPAELPGAAREQSASPQDAYLERMLAESVRNPSGAASLQSSSSPQELAPMLRELRAELKKEQRISAEAFLQRWREEFEKEQASAKQQISSALAEQVAAHASQTQTEIRAKLKAELEAGIEQAREALAEWRRQAEAFQEEARSISESLAGRAEQHLEEKLAGRLTALRQELVSSGVAVPVTGAPATENPAELLQNWRTRLDSEMAMTRAQWSELLESSLDSAAQRLVERLADNSQRLLQSAEKKLAARIAELEQESGRGAETARAAFDEIKTAFDREAARAKGSLEEFEKAAARFAESSREFESARQSGLNNLQSRLDAALASSAAQLDNRAAEASRQLESRQQHAEEVLRVHRERLRQVSEQTQREASEHASATLTGLRNQFDAEREEALAKWRAELEAGSVRAASEASASLAKTAEAAAADCSQKIRKSADDAIERFSAESGAKAEQNRVQLAAAAEQAVQNFQGYAHSALDHFQERVAVKMDQSTRQSQELLAAQLVATFDSFQNQGDSQVQEWTAKLQSASAATLERHEDRLRSAGDAWVDTSVRQLEAIGHTRMDAMIQAAESAMRKACVQALNGMAQSIRDQFAGEIAEVAKPVPPPVSETPKASPPGIAEAGSGERRASA